MLDHPNLEDVLYVEEHNVVTVVYLLREGGRNGPVLEQMIPEYPYSFLFGAEDFLVAFQEKLRGMMVNDSFEFILSVDEAYGPAESHNIIDLPKSLFQKEGIIPTHQLIKGSHIKLTDDLGEPHHGLIIAQKKDVVTVDFNHPLAGKDLYFIGKIVEIRKATTHERGIKAPVENGKLRWYN